MDHECRHPRKWGNYLQLYSVYTSLAPLVLSIPWNADILPQNTRNLWLILFLGWIVLF
jgi:hypothetical protein